MIILKVQKEFHHPTFRKHIFRRTTEGGSNWPRTVFLRLMVAHQSKSGKVSIPNFRKVNFKSDPEFVSNERHIALQLFAWNLRKYVYITKALSGGFQDLQTNPHDLVKKFLCDSKDRKWMYDGDCRTRSVLLKADSFENRGSRSLY